ncbi:hypothetical protein DPMN_105432 [Dreissena polymorpha]|uniref:Uncharacterized protein n=1 Tax=Dreissena polymorpha TaxID=45954 RepID=A0A9D4HDC0_DREPO|nr:hypothetical protein DPMN_105432 [Dreissena polymorpha]
MSPVRSLITGLVIDDRSGHRSTECPVTGHVTGPVMSPVRSLITGHVTGPGH